jgi:hypothetical protein
MITRCVFAVLTLLALCMAVPVRATGAEDAAALVQAIGAKEKTPDQKAQIVRAVVARMEQRAEELRAEVKKTPTAAAIQSLKDLEGYVLNLKGTEYRQDRWNSTSSWAYYTKMLGGNTIFLCPPFFDDSYNVSGATPQDKPLLLDIWLGERAALLIHESVHMKQQYYFASGDDEAWAATEEWLHVLNDARIQEYEELWKKSGLTFNSQILAECMRHLGGKSARKTQPHAKIDPMKTAWKDVVEGCRFPSSASPGQSRFGYTFCKTEPNTPNVAYQYGWCRMLEQGRTRVWLDANGNGKEDAGEVSEQPYWLWYMTQIDTRFTSCEAVPDAQGLNPQSMEWMKKLIAEAPAYRKVGIGEMGIAGMKAWESGGYTIYRGECKAVAGPLVVEVGVSTFFQAGPHFWPVGPAGLIAPSGSRIAVLDPMANRLAAFHGRAAVDEAVGLAVESAADAAQVQRYAVANFYWDTRAFAPTALAGYTRKYAWPEDKPNKDTGVQFIEPGAPNEPENYHVRPVTRNPGSRPWPGFRSATPRRSPT